MNLNETGIESDSGQVEQVNYSVLNGTTRCYFKNLRERLIEHIDRAQFVFGCVAWLTDYEILGALAKKKGVAIVVQKEDFLRPDTGENKFSRSSLQARYRQLPGTHRFEFDGLVGSLSQCADPVADPVRCVGVHNGNRAMAAPRMHHKFALFSEKHGVGEPPYAVWTGSFNWSVNATNSFENAVVLADPTVVRAYYDEFQQIFALSEPLDWKSEWIAPEWRIGT